MCLKKINKIIESNITIIVFLLFFLFGIFIILQGVSGHNKSPGIRRLDRITGLCGHPSVSVFFQNTG